MSSKDFRLKRNFILHWFLNQIFFFYILIVQIFLFPTLKQYLALMIK